MKKLALLGLLFLGCASTVPATKVGVAPTATDIKPQPERTTRFDNAPMMNVFHGRRG